MKKIIFNDYNLSDDDIEKSVIRVKALIINSSGKILIAHNNNTYQFPGGHLEDGEDMNECILREVGEETGISLSINEEPFLSITTYDNDYFGTGKKVKNSIYYYRFFCDDLPDFSKTHYDELELQSDFNLFYIPFSGFDIFLTKNIESGSIDENIGKEMLKVFEIYKEIYGV